MFVVDDQNFVHVNLSAPAALVDGKGNFEKCAGNPAILDIDPSSVGVDDAVGIAQSQSRAAAFGGEKGFENFRCMLSGYPMAFIFDDDLYLATVS
jgi:hypothetical protein